MAEATSAMLVSVLAGAGIAFKIVGKMLERSNDKGDSKGSYRDFWKVPLKIYVRKDRIKP